MFDISNLPKPVDLAFVKIEPSSNTDNSKAPVFIYHGIFSSKETWIPIAKEVAEKTKRTVYCFDIRDHDDSPWTNDVTYLSMIADLVNFANNHKIEKAILLGHSLGGLVFSRLCSLFPTLAERLIMVDIHPKRKRSNSEAGNVVKMFAGMLRKTIETINEQKMNLETAKAHISDVMKSFIKEEESRKGYAQKLVIRDGKVDWKFNLEGLIDLLRKMKDNQDDVVHYEGPVLEVYGTVSVFIGKDDFDSIRELLPNTRFESIDGADHIMHTTHPVEFIEKVVPFINE